MKNKKITRNISQGMYVLTTDGAGCMVDAVSQVSYGDNPLISVAVNKDNYTHDMIMKTKEFNISILTEKASFDTLLAPSCINNS